jgi:hypothetical protein
LARKPKLTTVKSAGGKLDPIQTYDEKTLKLRLYLPSNEELFLLPKSTSKGQLKPERIKKRFLVKPKVPTDDIFTCILENVPTFE